MKNSAIKVLAVFCLSSVISCSQINKTEVNETIEVVDIKDNRIQNKPHNYGGWYCPDNLNGFPAVDIRDWKNVSVVNGRMATKEETQNGASLIFVDPEEYPNAKPLDMMMPKLATFNNGNSGRDEYIIVIQAINVNNDSIVGFRYLNGGNGSARLNEVKFLDNTEIEKIPATRFVAQDLNIDATQDEIWAVMTSLENAEAFRQIVDREGKFKANWRESTNVNFHYPNSGSVTGAFAGDMYGSYYVQNDFDQMGYSEKFLLLEDEETKQTELKILSGPYGADFENQKLLLSKWAEKVKELSERK